MFSLSLEFRNSIKAFLADFPINPIQNLWKKQQKNESLKWPISSALRNFAYRLLNYCLSWVHFSWSVFTPMTSLPQYLSVFTVLQLDLSDHLESDSEQWHLSSALVTFLILGVFVLDHSFGATIEFSFKDSLLIVQLAHYCSFSNGCPACFSYVLNLFMLLLPGKRVEYTM